MEEVTSNMEPPPDSGIEPTAPAPPPGGGAEPTESAEPEDGGTKWWVWALIGVGALVLILFLVGLFNQDAETALAPSTDDSWIRVQTSGVLRVGTSADYPPFEYYNEQLAIDGFDMALVREIGNKLGVRTEISDFAFPSLPDAVRIGQIDVAMAALSITAEREAVADFTNIYYVGEDGILANQDSSIGEVTSASDVAGMRVGVQRGSVYEQLGQTNLVDAGFIPQQNLIVYDKADQIITDLERNALDVGAMDLKPAIDFAENRGVRLVGKGLNQQRFAIAAVNGANELINRINQALVELQNEGVISRLSEEYLDLAPGEIVPPPTPAPTPESCIDGSEVVRDLNYDTNDLMDLPELAPGEKFQKGWRLRNTGTCTWTSAYFAGYVRGNTPAAQMGGQPTSIVGEVKTGQTYDLYVNLQAPQDPGEFVAYWQMHNNAQTAFGETFVVGIEVPGPTPVPSETPTATEVPTGTPEPTNPIELTATPTETDVPPEATATEVPPEATATSTPVPGAEIMDQLWRWVSLQESEPAGQSNVAAPEKYDLVLISDFTFTATADCRELEGTYEITATELTLEIGPVASVECDEGSLSSQYIQLLGEVDAWALLNNQLFLGVGDGAAVMGYKQSGPPPQN
jgi:polar amino acid transport system substrate-binding protein